MNLDISVCENLAPQEPHFIVPAMSEELEISFMW